MFDRCLFDDNFCCPQIKRLKCKYKASEKAESDKRVYIISRDLYALSRQKSPASLDALTHALPSYELISKYQSLGPGLNLESNPGTSVYLRTGSESMTHQVCDPHYSSAWKIYTSICSFESLNITKGAKQSGSNETLNFEH
jgi:hypothetical protein